MLYKSDWKFCCDINLFGLKREQFVQRSYQRKVASLMSQYYIRIVHIKEIFLRIVVKYFELEAKDFKYIEIKFCGQYLLLYDLEKFSFSISWFPIAKVLSFFGKEPDLNFIVPHISQFKAVREKSFITTSKFSKFKVYCGK